MPCESACWAMARRAGSVNSRSTDSSSSLSSARSGVLLRGQDVEETVEHGADPSADLDGRLSVVTDLADGELEVVLPVPAREHEPGVPVAIGQNVAPG